VKEAYLRDVPGDGGVVEGVPNVAVDVAAGVGSLDLSEERGHVLGPAATPGPGSVVEHGAAGNVRDEGAHSVVYSMSKHADS